MGLLAESKNRRKISKDPNNTKWTRDTSTFGQKILRAQGWEPGQYLGAKDAGHSKLHTAASASYIRVSLKDDMKGLGFNKAKEDEVTGLNVFSDLLSRLNGKSEQEVEGDRRARLAMKTNVYVEQKWGAMRFVRGGLLVGDNMEKRTGSDRSAAAAMMDGTRQAKDESSKKERKSKKRILEDDEQDQHAEADSKQERKRRKAERRARKAAASGVEDADQSSDAKSRKKKTEKKSLPSDDANTKPCQPDCADDGSPKRARKSKSKSKDKRPHAPNDEDAAKARNATRKDKKDKSKRKKMDAANASESGVQEDHPIPAAVTGTSTPTASGTGTLTPNGGRNFVRSQFIAAKRQAMLDAKSLNQIFMIKT